MMQNNTSDEPRSDDDEASNTPHDEPYANDQPSDTQVSDTETKHATNYSPSSERETASRQANPQTSAATNDVEADDADVKVLPGTGGPDDPGDVEVDGDDINLPTG